MVAELAIGTVRLVSRLVPTRVKKRVEDGIFHYIFQKTRVENDAYGWRPETPGGGEAPPGARPPATPQTGAPPPESPPPEAPPPGSKDRPR